MSLPPSYFDDMYAGSQDPWGFTTRWYEQRKYALTTAALPMPRYARALEVGCSIGVLSARLATRCQSLLSVDVSAAALAAAAGRVPDNVELRHLAVPGQWPDGRFDLVVLSEVGYYLSPADLGLLLDRVEGCLLPGGDLVACHWRHPVGDYPQTGDAVHRALAGRKAWHLLSRVEEEDFLLDVLSADPASVAARTGLLA